MKPKNLVLQETGIVVIGQSIATAAMIGIFALAGCYDTTVLLGGIAGALIATANFFLMTLFACLAADKAEAQDVASGQKLIQLSYMGRMIGLFLALFLCAKSGYFHVLALVIPLVFTRPILTIGEIFKKKGDRKA